LKKSTKPKKHLILFKDNFINKILVLPIILIFLITSFSAAQPQNPTTITTTDDQMRSIVWDVTVNFNELGGAYDYTVFGEATDANDGPPVDAYDVLKPPAPMPPYIRAWFNDNLPVPFDTLAKDYRHYPGNSKVWNLSVQWVPSNYVSPTTITLTWSPTAINSTEYASITLCTSGGTPLKNMLLYSTYSFNCPAMIPQAFKIICTVMANQPPYAPSSPSPANGTTGVSVTADLSWTGGDPDGDSVTYDVYFGTSSSPPKVVGNQTGTSYDPGTMSYSTLYYWKIVAWDEHGAKTSGPKWHFTTPSQPNHPPNAPNNPSPSNGSIEVSVNVDLSWSGGDPDSGDFVTYDVYCGNSFPLTKLASNISGTSHAIGPLQYSTKYYWKIIAWDNHQASNASPLWSFTSKTDTTLPTVKITSPIKGFLYVNLGDIITRKLPIFITTIVIGKIDVTVTATDSQSGIKRVEFYLDNDLKTTETTAPYMWTWSEWGFFFPHTIKVIAFDCVGNQKSTEMRVWKIF
jgi:hypothetical protein